MTNKEIQNLIKFVAKSGVAEVKLKDGDFAISIKNIQEQVVTTATPSTTPVQTVTNTVSPTTTTEPAPASNVSDDKKAEDDSKYLTIKSPMIGTFYRKPSPDKDTFVNVGDNISEGDVVCIIEAMKLFNEIESEISGKIVKVLVDDSTPVEYDQPLFLVEPS